MQTLERHSSINAFRKHESGASADILRHETTRPLIIKCKKHFIKMFKDVGMVVPKIKETRLE